MFIAPVRRQRHRAEVQNYSFLKIIYKSEYPFLQFSKIIFVFEKGIQITTNLGLKFKVLKSLPTSFSSSSVWKILWLKGCVCCRWDICL